MAASRGDDVPEFGEEAGEEFSPALYWKILALRALVGRRSIRRVPGHEVEHRYPPIGDWQT